MWNPVPFPEGISTSEASFHVIEFSISYSIGYIGSYFNEKTAGKSICIIGDAESIFSWQVTLSAGSIIMQKEEIREELRDCDLEEDVHFAQERDGEDRC